MISVIVPCFNAARTVISTLDSLRKQIFKDYEVIIVDDGSTDNTDVLVKEYINSNRDIAIHYFEQVNSGVSVARNNGLKHCRGDYITFLDADDAYTPDFLQVLVQKITEDDHDFAFCKYAQVFSIYENIDDSDSSFDVLDKYEALDRYMHKRITKINLWSGIYKRSIIDKYRIEFPIGMRYGEDSVFLCKYVFHCKDGVLVNRIMYKYLVCDTSAMHKSNYAMTQNIDAFKIITEYWKKDYRFDNQKGEYMIARAMWATAKELCLSKKDDFKRFLNEYDVNDAMRLMVQKGDELSIRISSRAFLLSPILFWILVRNLYFIKGIILHFNKGRL